MANFDINDCKYINLSELLELIDGDLETVKVLLDEFVDVSPVDIQELIRAFQEEDYIIIIEKAHKLKATFKYFGISSSKDLIEIENLAKQNSEISSMKIIFDSVLIDYENALIEAKALINA